MGKYESFKTLPSRHFRRLTGVKRDTFEKMTEVLERARNNRYRKAGRKGGLSIEDKLLMALEYLREYRTYFHLGKSYGLSESACYRSCRWVENTLVKSGEFALPGKKALLKSDVEYAVILIDASESPVERPKKRVKEKKKDQEPQQQTEIFLLREKEKTYSEKPNRGRQEDSECNLHSF